MESRLAGGIFFDDMGALSDSTDALQFIDRGRSVVVKTGHFLNAPCTPAAGGVFFDDICHAIKRPRRTGLRPSTSKPYIIAKLTYNA